MTDERREASQRHVPMAMTDKELQELLDAPETPEEKATLDALMSDPEEVLEWARRRAAEIEKAPPPREGEGGAKFWRC